jgi:hypothetical protein
MNDSREVSHNFFPNYTQDFALIETHNMSENPIHIVPAPVNDYKTIDESIVANGKHRFLTNDEALALLILAKDSGFRLLRDCTKKPTRKLFPPFSFRD